MGNGRLCSLYVHRTTRLLACVQEYLKNVKILLQKQIFAKPEFLSCSVFIVSVSAAGDTNITGKLNPEPKKCEQY